MNMLTRPLIIAGLVMLGIAAQVHADYTSQYNEARTLFYKGKAADALPLATEAVKLADTQVQKAESLRLASTIALRLKQRDQAMEFAKQIPIKAVSLNAQADVLKSQKQREAIIALYASEDQTGWAPADASEAWHHVADAHYHLMQGKEALAAYTKAIEADPSNRNVAHMYQGSGNTWRALLQDNVKAMEAYNKVFDVTPNTARHAEAAMAIAAIHLGQNEQDKALEALNRIDMLKLTPTYLRVEILRRKAGILADKGKKEEALTLYRQALEHHDIYAFQKKACEEAIAALQGSDSKTAE